MIFFLTYRECSILILIGHHARLRDLTDQSYPINDCTHANHARYLIGPRYIFW